MITELNGSPAAVPLDGFSLEAPGVRGRVQRLSKFQTRALGSRKAERLDEVLNTSDPAEDAPSEVRAVFELEVEEDGVDGAVETRSRAAGMTTNYGEAAMRFKAPRVAGKDQAVLYTDEAGFSRWVLPQQRAASTDAESSRGGAGDLVFLLPQKSAAIDSQASSRGRISKIGRRVIRVVAWATGRLIGKGALAIASLWENRARKYGLYLLPGIGGDSDIDWNSLRGHRSLLLIHGTFSSTAASFNNLDPAVLDFFRQRYGQRVLTFDHPSLHHDPEENIRGLMKFLPPDADLDLDIICHSRGGLVARELALRAQEHGLDQRRIKVNRIVLVAVPNAGTILTDGMHDIVMLDRFTNLIAELPDNQYTLWFEGIMAVLKLLLHGGLKGLPGLQAMVPGGEYQRSLNAVAGPADLSYYAIGADFKPAKGPLALFGRRGDQMLDEIFGEANDAVVPTRGAYLGNAGAFGFPIGDGDFFVFGEEAQVHHCNYFSGQRILPYLQQWLD